MKCNGIVKEFKCVPEICSYNSPDYKIYGVRIETDKYPDIKLNKYGNVSVVGNFHDLGVGIEYQVKAEEHDSKKGFGTQYKVINIKRQRPTDEYSTRQFLYEILTSKQTDTLLEVYPDIVDKVINNKLNDIDLNKTPGIKEYTFDIIKKKIIENFCLVELVEEFQGMLNISILKKLYDKYSSIQKIRSELKDQPYKCLCGLWGVGFKTADSLILEIDRVSREKITKGEKPIINFGYDIQSSPQREKACIMYLLEENENNGHTRMDVKELKKQCEKLAPSCIHHFVDIIKNDAHLYFDKLTMSVALYKTYITELYISNRLKDALQDSQTWDIDWERFKVISENISLTDEQSKVLDYVCKYNLLILNGFSGTGKSQTTTAIIDMLKNHDKTFKLFSPTGRAAKVLSGYTNCPTSTIHRGLGFRPPNEWLYSEENKLTCDVVIIDEFGMVDVFLFEKVLKAIDFTQTKLLLVGDSAQIMSVGAGNCLHDMLNSKIIPTVSLTKVFRYGEGGLMTVATKTRESIKFVDEKSKEVQIFGSDKSYYFIPTEQDKAIKNIKQLYMKLLSQKYQPKDILVLSCYNKGNYGTKELNTQLQPLANDIKNKSKYSFGETTFYQDDLVIQCVNNYDARIYPFTDSFSKTETMLIPNGEIGVVSEILSGAMVVDFDGVRIYYDKDNINMLKLAYSISTHKSQGGQAKVVILFTPQAHTYMLNSNLVYVGQTRAKEKVYHFGESTTVNRVIKKKADLDRQTFLKQLLNFNKQEYKTTIDT